MSTKKRGLGRGLEALLGAGSKSAAAITQDATPEEREALRELAIQSLQPGKYQPRSGMDPERLTELADSIKVQGVIQPIVVRALGKDRFEIIAGERRWRAARQAGLDKVPVVVREVDDRAVIAMALIENIQREDLNPLEEALAIQRLIDEFALTHQQAAEAVGRSRASVSNLLRLLEMPGDIRALVEQKKLEMGHARALLTLSPAAASALAKEAAEQQWSVREVERRAQLIAQGKAVIAKSTAKPAQKSDADIKALENELSERLATRVQVQHGRGGRGKLVIAYTSLDTLDGLLEKLRR